MFKTLKNNQKLKNIILIILLLLVFLLLGLYGLWSFKKNELKDNDNSIKDTDNVKDICNYNTGNESYDLELNAFCESLENKEKYKIYTNINQLEYSRITSENIEKINELLVSIPDKNSSLYSASNFYYLSSPVLSDILFGYIQYEGNECVSKDLLKKIANIIYGEYNFSEEGLYIELSEVIDDKFETDNFYCRNYHKNDFNGNIKLNYAEDLIYQYDNQIYGKIYSYTRVENDGSKYNVILTYNYNNKIYKLDIFNAFKDTDLDKIDANESVVNLTQADKDKIEEDFSKIPFYSIDTRQYRNAKVGENIFDSDLERADLALYYIFNEEVWENKLDKSYLKCDDEDICGVKLSYVHEVSREFFGQDFDESKLNQQYSDGYAYAGMGGGYLAMPLLKEKRYNHVTNEYSLIFDFYNEMYFDPDQPVEETAERKAIIKYKINNGKKILTSWVYTK